jgi:hypothetical protein
MRHLRMVGLCLVAVFAIAAVAATSASALPEWGQCYVQAKHEGKYTDKNCTVKAKVVNLKPTGEFEWRKATEVAKKTFTGEAGAGVLEGKYILCATSEGAADTKYGRKGLPCPAGDHEAVFFEKPIKVECESEANHGEITGAKTVAHVSVVFRGCKVLGSSPCSNTVNEGEIRVNTLKGTLGFVNKNATPREVGLLLEPAVKKGEFASFTCLTGQLGTIVGEGNETEGCAYPLKACGGDGIIGAQTPVDEMVTHYSQKFTINEATQENIPSKFEGTAPLKVLESYLFNEEEPQFTSQWSKAGEAITNVTTSEEATEVKAK